METSEGRFKYAEIFNYLKCGEYPEGFDKADKRAAFFSVKETKLYYCTASGDDLRVVEFEQDKMRDHLAECFEKKLLTPFPHVTHSTPYVQHGFPLAHEIDLYCVCELPEEYDNMIQCNKCDSWYHFKCVGLKSPFSSNWFCKTCAI